MTRSRRRLHALVTAIAAAWVAFVAHAHAHAQDATTTDPVSTDDRATEARDADAEPQAATRADPAQLFWDGTHALEAGDVRRGATLLERSLDLRPHPATAYNLVAALRSLGEVVEATEVCRLLAAGRYGALPRTLETQATRVCELLEREAAVIEIEACCAPEIAVYVDHQRVGVVEERGTVRRVVSPGRHGIAVEARGHLGDARTLELREGENARVALSLVALASERGATDATGTGGDGAVGWWIAGGVALAAIVTTVVLFLALEGDDVPRSTLPPNAAVPAP